MQNSIDAGAKSIEFLTESDALTVRDDGHGIHRDRLIEALLTMGGSVKEEGAIGGHGAAKELLLFAHECYEIRTLGVKVWGRVLSYVMEDVSPSFVGTEIRIVFSERFGRDREVLRANIRNFIATCHLPGVSVSLDGEPLVADQKGRLSDIPFGFGKVYVRRLPEGETTSVIYVRVRGVTMFSRWTSPCSKQVIVELEGDTRAHLATNRDHLRGDADAALSKIVASMSVDNRSFDRPRAVRHVFDGREAQFYTAAIRDAANIQASASGASRELVFSILYDVKTRIAEGTRIETAIAAAVERCQAGASPEAARAVGAVLLQHYAHFETNFVVSIENTGFRGVPRYYRPASMSAANLAIAQLWKHVVEHTMRAASIACNYRVGFTLDPEKCASFSAGEDGVIELLINPDKLGEIKDRRERFYRIVQLAAHELAHRKWSAHHESFVIESETIHRKSICALPPMGAVVRAAKQVRL